MGGGLKLTIFVIHDELISCTKCRNKCNEITIRSLGDQFEKGITPEECVNWFTEKSVNNGNIFKAAPGNGQGVSYWGMGTVTGTAFFMPIKYDIR